MIVRGWGGRGKQGGEETVKEAYFVSGGGWRRGYRGCLISKNGVANWRNPVAGKRCLFLITAT